MEARRLSIGAVKGSYFGGLGLRVKRNVHLLRCTTSENDTAYVGVKLEGRDRVRELEHAKRRIKKRCLTPKEETLTCRTTEI